MPEQVQHRVQRKQYIRQDTQPMRTVFHDKVQLVTTVNCGATKYGWTPLSWQFHRPMVWCGAIGQGTAGGTLIS